MKVKSRGYVSALERHRTQPRAAFVEERFGGEDNVGAELARSEGVERQKTHGKIDGGEAALAKEPAQKIGGRFVPFLRVALQAAGDEISIRVSSQCGLRHDMVQALHFRSEAAEAVKAPAVLALVDRLAKGLGLQEIGFLKIFPGGQRGGILGFDLLGAGLRGENFVGQAHFDNVVRFAALDQTQNALAKEAAQPLARGANGKTSSMGEPADRKTITSHPVVAHRCVWRLSAHELHQGRNNWCKGSSCTRDDGLDQGFRGEEQRMKRVMGQTNGSFFPRRAWLLAVGSLLAASAPTVAQTQQAQQTQNDVHRPDCTEPSQEKVAASSFVKGPGKDCATTKTEPAPAQPQIAPQNRRLFWVLPNYTTVAEREQFTPLSAGTKFKLSAKTMTDPVTVSFIGGIALLGQARNSDPTYGQGFQGYDKRFATFYADTGIGTLMTTSVFPTLLRQDPRYFLLGKGSKWHRALYAASRIFIAPSDHGDLQFNYSESWATL